MNTLSQARRDLANALLEWRDAGGNVWEVVGAIETLAQEVAERQIDACSGDNR